MGEYVLGASDREIERLSYQHEIWQDETVALWKEVNIGIGSVVADLGCGPGLCTDALARLVGLEGIVYAVDMSEKFSEIMSKKNAPNIRFERGDVTQTSIPDSSSDMVFSRWLYSFLGDLEAGIEESKRILKKGGHLVVLDYFNYLAADTYPQFEGASSLFEAFAADVESHNGSWEAGGKLPALIAAFGFEIVELKPICRIARPGSREWRWVEYFAEVTVPRVFENGIWTEEERLRFEQDWQRLRETPGAFLFTPPMIGIVAKKI